MSYKAIIANLRRSACEDDDPWNNCSMAAFREAFESLLYAVEFWEHPNSPDDVRIFLLIVAEALDSVAPIADRA
jgi:hypothetical protein